MTATNRPDRALATWMAEVAARPVPAGGLDRIAIETSGRKPLPRPFASLGSRWPGRTDVLPAPARLRPSPRLTLGGMVVAVVAVVIATQALRGVALPPGATPSTTHAATQSDPSPTPHRTSNAGEARLGEGWTWTPRWDSGSPASEVQLGLLDPGRYELLNVDEQGFNARFTVPAGWTWNGRYLSKRGTDAPGGAAIWFFGGPVQVYDDPCHWVETQPSPRAMSQPRPNEIVDALAAQPGRDPTPPIDLAAASEGGGAGRAIVLSVPDVDFAGCDGGEYRSWGPASNARSHQASGQLDVVWALDIRGASVEGTPAPPGGLVVDAAFFPGTPRAIIDEMEQILGSLYLGHWG